MQEFTSVIASSYDAESLAPMLTEKAGEGWTVVSIVSAGTNVVAYLTRGGDAAAAPTAAAEPAVEAEPVAAEAEPEPEPAVEEGAAVAAAATAISPTLPGESAVGAAEPDPTETAAGDEADVAADEPAGWGTAPADDAGTSSEASVAELAEQIGGEAATTAAVAGAAEPEPAAAPAEEAAPAEAGVPAGWYADPSGRFELRYWDGQAWTEHVSRAGQQYTDPPVA